MKSILALMVAGLLASTAAVAQEKMAAPAGTPEATAPSGEQPAKKTAHHKRKRVHKSAMAKDDAGMKKSEAKTPGDSTKSEAPSSEMKK